MGNTPTFVGYAVGLRSPMALEAVVARLRACVDPLIKAETAFDSMQVPHVTLAVGIEAQYLEEVSDIVKEKLPITISVEALSLLHALDYDVLVKRVKAERLVEINRMLCKRFDLDNAYPYEPHITIGFLKNTINVNAPALDERVPCPSHFAVNEIILFNPKGKPVFVKDDDKQLNNKAEL